MRRSSELRFLFVLLVLWTGALSLAIAETTITTGLEGTILISPARPGPARQGIDNSAPLQNAEFTVETEKAAVASFTTDDQGRFRVSLPAGHYKISRNPKTKFGCAFEVDITAGQIKNVQWLCNSGLL